MDYNDTNKLKALGSFVIFEKLEGAQKTSIKLVHQEPYSKGKVVGTQETYSSLPTGTEILYITERASPLGLGYSPYIFVVRYDDIISMCLPD
jgi:hypothetical protein